MKDYLAHFLLNATAKQSSQTIKSLSKEQLEWLVENNIQCDARSLPHFKC